MSDEGVKVRGFYRVQIDEDGEIVGDSGWLENQVVNLGFNWYLAGALGAIANSSQVSYMALGTGGAPAAADTGLANEVESRTAVTAATSSDSKAVRFTATFTSAQSFVTTTMPISNIGLFRSVTAGTLFSGAAYASSNVASNQNVNATYDISFS
jgi:L-lactate permease